MRQADNYSMVWHDMSQTLRQHSEHLHQVEIATWSDLEHFQITICSYDSWEERQSKIAAWDFVDEAFQVFQDAKDALWSFCISKDYTETTDSNVIIQYWSALLDYKRSFHDVIYLRLPSDQEMDSVNIQYRDEFLARFNSALANPAAAVNTGMFGCVLMLSQPATVLNLSIRSRVVPCRRNISVLLKQVLPKP